MTTPTATPDEAPLCVAGVYATRWRYWTSDPQSNAGKRGKRQRRIPEGKTEAGESVESNPFADTRFEQFAAVFKDQLLRLPRLIAPRQMVTDEFQIDSYGLLIRQVKVYLFALPSDQVVATLVVECGPSPSLTDPLDRFDRMLDDFTEQAFTIRGLSLPEFLIQIAPVGVENFAGPTPAKPGWLRRVVVRSKGKKQPQAVLHKELPEQHEIVYLRGREPLAVEHIENLLYRRKPRHQKEFSRQLPVPELMERYVAPTDAAGDVLAGVGDGRKLGVVTTRSSLIKGHDPLVESSVLLSAVQGVGTLARFRDIWDRAEELVIDFRHNKMANDTGVQRRDDLEELVDELGNLQFDLAFSVELPLMRVETYHKHLSDVLDLTHQAKRLSEMFAQISGSIRSEITAIDIRASRKNDLRSRRNGAASMFLATLGIPIGVLLAFFGINAKQVEGDESMFNWELYWWAYAVAGLLMIVPAFALLFARVVQAVERRRGERRRR